MNWYCDQLHAYGIKMYKCLFGKKNDSILNKSCLLYVHCDIIGVEMSRWQVIKFLTFMHLYTGITF